MNVRTWLDQNDTLPLLERQLLLCHYLGVGTATLLATPEHHIDADQLAGLSASAGRVAAGEPLAYLLGEAGFWDFMLKVTPAVLIPRPETETLVEQALSRIRPGDRLLDLGTGSGAIAIALARHTESTHTEATIVAIDRSEAALTVARANAARLEVEVDFKLSCWFDALDGIFDLIVANPPYVAAADPHLPALRFEPAEALIGGPDGLLDLARIITGAPDYLSAQGWLLVEHGYDQAEGVAELFRHAGFRSIELVHDLGGQPRVTIGQRP